MPGLGVDAQRSTLLRCGEEFFGQLESQLVRRQLVVDVGALRLDLARIVRIGHHSLEVRAVAADADIDRAPLRIVEQLDGVDNSRVDFLEVAANQLFQTAGPGDRAVHPVLATEVEVGQPVGPSLVTRGDLVELVFHRRCEVVIDQPREVLLQQADDSERHPGRHQRAALLVHVAAVLDGLDDRAVGRRPADAQIFERLDQRGLGVAGRRARGVPVGGQTLGVDALALRQVRQSTLGVVGLTAGLLIEALHVRLEEAGERDRAAAGVEHDLLASTSRAGDAQTQRRPACVGHLRGHGALPDQLVEPELVGVQGGVQLARRREHVTGGPDRLVRLLRVLHLAGVLAWRRMHVLLAVELLGLSAGRVDGRLRQRGRVGTHVGDVAVLVQPLRDAHRALGGEPQLAPGLLLQRRRHERRVRPARVGLLLHRSHLQLRPTQARGQRVRRRLVEDEHLVGLLQPTQRIEVTPGRHPPPVDRVQLGGERRWRGLRVGDAGVELGGDIPVAGAAERHPLAFPLHDDARRDRLHPARGELRRDLLPQHGADFVAVQAVEDAAGLLSVDQRVVQIAWILGGSADRRLGDLVEHHALDRDARLERFEQVPGDRLALAVTVRRQIELVDALEQVLQLGDGALLLRADDVERLEVLLDVDPETGPRLRFVLRRDVGRVARQVTDVSAGRLDDVVGPEIAGDFARLGRRLDYDEPPHSAVSTAVAVSVSHLSGSLSRLLLLILCAVGRLAHRCATPPRQRTISHSARADANRLPAEHLSLSR